MNHSQKRHALSLALSAAILLAVCGIGAGSTMVARRGCAVEAGRVKSAEQEIRKLRRENDFWTAQIARSHDPAALRKRAGTKLMLPSGEKVVFAYRVFDTAPDGTRVARRILSYKTSDTPLKTARR